MDRSIPRGPSLAVIDTPPAPPGWDDARADLVRIVDPLGRAVAWLAPAFGGRCVGLAVRPSGERGTAWVQLFNSADPGSLLDGSGEAGCSARCVLVPRESNNPIDLGRFWRFVERDPIAATLAASPERDVPEALRELVSNLVLRFTAGLNQEALRFQLRVENHGLEEVALLLGLNLAIVAVQVRDASGSVDVRLPETIPGYRGKAVPPQSVVSVGAAGSPVVLQIELTTGISGFESGAAHEGETVLLFASAGEEPREIITLGAGESYDISLAVAATPSRWHGAG